MEIPDLNRVIETFVRYQPFPESHLPEIGKQYDLALKHGPGLGVSVSKEGFHVWQSACWTLRVAVVPLLHQLVQSGLINWHWTLVHNSASGFHPLSDIRRSSASARPKRASTCGNAPVGRCESPSSRCCTSW
jgi:hypothetical protein